MYISATSNWQHLQRQLATGNQQHAHQQLATCSRTAATTRGQRLPTWLIATWHASQTKPTTLPKLLQSVVWLEKKGEKIWRPQLRQKQWPSKAAVVYHFVRVCCVLFAAGMQTHAPLGHTRQSWGVLGKRLKNWMDGPPRWLTSALTL